jgi:hypothetical protein
VYSTHFGLPKVPDPIQQLALLSDIFGGTSQYVTENANVGSLPKFEFDY